ncbi:MAG: type II secretion system protein [Nannocystaceae bacterium]
MPSRRHLSRSRGMTIIEILIVLAIFSLMVAMIVVGFGSTRAAEVSSTVNNLGNVIRYGYDRARVNGTYHRLHIDLDKGTFTLQEGSDRMYLPATDRDGKIIEFDPAKAEEQAERDKRAEDAYNRSIQAEVFGEGGGGSGGDMPAYDPYKAQEKKVPRRKPPLFESFEEENAVSGLVKPIKLPDGVKITYVRTADDVKPITEGEASLFFFPRGTTQECHILLEDEEGENRWTIKVAPLTGRVTIIEGHEELEVVEVAGEDEDELGRSRSRRTF